jgi:hypothetical protein
MPTTLAFHPSPDDLDEGYLDVPVLTFTPPEFDAPTPESTDTAPVVS